MPLLLRGAASNTIFYIKFQNLLLANFVIAAVKDLITALRPPFVYKMSK